MEAFIRDVWKPSYLVNAAPLEDEPEKLPCGARRTDSLCGQLPSAACRTLGLGLKPHFTTRGPGWHADAYRDATGADGDLLTLDAVGHGLGGVAGLDAKETETESPDGLEALKRLTLAWLQTALGVDPNAWMKSRTALEGPAASLGEVVSRRSTHA